MFNDPFSCDCILSPFTCANLVLFPSPVIFLSQIIPFLGVSSFPNCRGYSFFIALSPLTFILFKCLTPYSGKNKLWFSCFCLTVCHVTHSFVSFCLFLSGKRTPFNTSYNAVLVVVRSFVFCLSGKDIISPSYLKDAFARYIIFGWWFSIFWIFDFTLS